MESGRARHVRCRRASSNAREVRSGGGAGARGLRLSMDSKHSSSSSTLSGSMSWSCPPSSACLDGAIAAYRAPAVRSEAGGEGKLKRGERSTHERRRVRGEAAARTCGRRRRRPRTRVGWDLGEKEGKEAEARRETGPLVSCAAQAAVCVVGYLKAHRTFSLSSNGLGSSSSYASIGP